MNIKAIIHPAEEGGFWAEVPALPGYITEGDTMEEIKANLKDGLKLQTVVRRLNLPIKLLKLLYEVYLWQTTLQGSGEKSWVLKRVTGSHHIYSDLRKIILSSPAW